MLLRQALLVEPVARFMEDAKEGVAEVVQVVARGDPHVARPSAAAEGMIGHVEPAGGEVEADRGGGLLAELLLQVDGELSLEDGRIGAAAAADDLLDQRRKRIAETG